MSSTLRSFAQIPARVKYLIAVADGDSSGEILDDSCFAFTVPVGTITSSVITSSVAEDLDIDTVEITAGDLFKDLGRQIVVCDATTDAHLAIFREVQEVAGAGTEGVPAAAFDVSTYVKVWSSTGGGVVVTRTGPGGH